MSTITSIEFEGFFYVETSDGLFGKGCRRCGGTGHYSFNGYDSICYACQNVWEYRLGDLFETRQEAEKWCHGKALRAAAAQRKRDAEAIVRQRQLEQKQAMVQQTWPDVYEFLMAVDLGDQYLTEEEAYAAPDTREKDSFIRSMAEQIRWAVNRDRRFTDNMAEAVRRTIAKRQERTAEAAAHPVPAGRQVVTGEIVGTKVVDGDYGVAYKITVRDDRGFRIYVSLPKAQADEAFASFREEYLAAGHDDYTFGPTVWFEGTADGQASQWKGLKGRRITFTATLEQSRDDQSFGFGSRPTKGAWL